MIKLFALLRRHDDVSDADFVDYWRGEFVARLRAAADGRIRRIVLSAVVEPDFRPGTNAAGHVWHGIGEYYVDHEAVAFDLLADSRFHVAATGSPAIVAAATHLPTHEVAMYDTLAAADPVRVLGFFNVTRPGFVRADAHSYWARHMAVANEHKADTIIRRYAQNATFLAFRNPDPRFDYDGASSIWCDTRADAARIYHDPALMEAMREDELSMGCTPDGCVYLRTRDVTPAD